MIFILRWVFIDGCEGEALEVSEEVDGRVEVAGGAMLGVASQEAGAHIVRVGQGVDVDRLSVVLCAVLEVCRELACTARQTPLEAVLLW